MLLQQLALVLILLQLLLELLEFLTLVHQLLNVLLLHSLVVVEFCLEIKQLVLECRSVFGEHPDARTPCEVLLQIS